MHDAIRMSAVSIKNQQSRNLRWLVSTRATSF